MSTVWHQHCCVSDISVVSFQGKNVPEALTYGEWEVQKILAHDDINEKVLVNKFICFDIYLTVCFVILPNSLGIQLQFDERGTNLKLLLQ